ncbi:MAG: pyridoxal phosphate-dependent aminotransferase [Planctomycetota bacterium]
MEPHERISSKLAKFRPSLTLELKRMAAERAAQGMPVHDFGLGETKGILDDPIRDAGIAAYTEGATMYGDPAGMPELRKAVLDWLDVAADYDVGNVVITAGAKQSLFNIFLAVCNPGDTVLFDEAPWVSYQPLAVAAYATPVMVLPITQRDNHTKVTPEDLLRNVRMRPHARLFLLNNPVNPTAQLYDADEVNALLDVCVDHGIYFLLDRLYWRLIFDGRDFPEPRVDERSKPWLIQVDGLSKNFRRTGGLRIGWSVAPTDVSSAMVNLQSHYTSGPAIPTQHSALAAITRPYTGSLRDELQRKRDLLHEHGMGMPHVRIWPTPATFYSFWDVTDALGRRTPEGEVLDDSDAVAAYLIRAAGVVTASGTGFMQDGYLRLSFTTPDEDIVAGMAAAKQALGALR